MVLSRQQNAGTGDSTNSFKNSTFSRATQINVSILVSLRARKYLTLNADDDLILASSQDICNGVLDALNHTFEVTKGDGNML